MNSTLYGLVAEFDSPAALLEATRKAYGAGYRRMDAYSPFPVEELSEALGVRKDYVSLITLAGGLLGGLSAYALQWWINKIAYPINIGGRPLHSWPAFIIVTFEMTILFAGIAAVVGMLALNGLPLPHHPVFNARAFERVSRDRFVLCIEALDPQFDSFRTRTFLERLEPISLEEVSE